jgi:hypothetical protein
VTPLRQRMLEDLQIRHYSPTTIRLYLYAVRAFAKHFGRPPDQLGAEHIRRYQLFLTKEKKVSTSTYVMMVCGLRFFYTHTLPKRPSIMDRAYPLRGIVTRKPSLSYIVAASTNTTSITIGSAAGVICSSSFARRRCRLFIEPRSTRSRWPVGSADVFAAFSKELL